MRGKGSSTRSMMLSSSSTTPGSAMHVAQYTVDPTGSSGVLSKPIWEEAFDPLSDSPT
jgi:hypothetical protein